MSHNVRKLWTCAPSEDLDQPAHLLCDLNLHWPHFGYSFGFFMWKMNSADCMDMQADFVLTVQYGFSRCLSYLFCEEIRKILKLDIS